MLARLTLFALALSPTTVTAQNQGIVNGSFVDGLEGWTTEIRGGGNNPGTVSAGPGGASFREGASTVVSLQQVFRVPRGSAALSFKLLLLLFDRTSRQAGDRVEVSLLDPTTGTSVVPTWKADSQAFVSAWEGGVGFGKGVRVFGANVLQDLRAVVGRTVRLRVDLIGGDDDRSSLMFVNDFQPEGCAESQKPTLTKAPDNSEFRVVVGKSQQFEIEFTAFAGRRIRSLAVQSSDLRGFTWAKPTLGKRASVIATWSPEPSQASTRPYPVRFTATDDCSTPQSATVTVNLFAECDAPVLTKAPKNNEVRAKIDQTSEFEIEFTAGANRNITSLAVDSADLRRFTWKIQKSGRRASAIATWSPEQSQFSRRPYPVRFTAIDDCTPPKSGTVTVSLFAVCGAPVLTEAPANHEKRVLAGTSEEFEIAFAADPARKITKLTVESSDLPGFTWSKPMLGHRASVVARFAPDRKQISTNPYPVRFTATDDCPSPQSSTVTIQLFASCVIPTKTPPGNAIATAANASRDFEIEFGTVAGHKITNLVVDSSNLRGFTWSKPTLGQRASVVARWAPKHSQILTSPHMVRFWVESDCVGPVPTTTASVTIALSAYEVGCGLMLGGSRTNVDLGNGDFLLVNPALTYVITNRMPAFPVPNDRRLAGLRLFSQVFMGNQLRRHDPLMLSNGLEIVLGERASPYGSDRFMRLGTRTVPKLGGKLEFDLAIR